MRKCHEQECDVSDSVSWAQKRKKGRRREADRKWQWHTYRILRGRGEGQETSKWEARREEPEKHMACESWRECGESSREGADIQSQPLGSPPLLALLVKILLNGSCRETEPSCHTVIWREPLPRMTIWVRFEFSTINKNQIGLMPMYSKYIRLEMEPAISQFSPLLPPCPSNWIRWMYQHTHSFTMSGPNICTTK